MVAFLLQMLSALVGAAIVYVFGVRNLSVQRRNAFIEKQLSEFYSPIAGCRKRIRAKSELREKISGAAKGSWQDLCARYSDAQQIRHNHEDLFAPYKSIIEYDNQQLRDELIPLYRKMLDVFTEKYWLADEDTRVYYQDFLEFVEIWERFLAEALPGEVIKKLDHTEENLRPFYEHVEQKLSTLQIEVKDQRFSTYIKSLTNRIHRTAKAAVNRGPDCVQHRD